MKMTIERIAFPLIEPFYITGYVFETADTVWVTLEDDGHIGRGEASGVYYMDETDASMAKQLEGVKALVEDGATRQDIQKLLPPGGARNALDCAFWDLEAKKSGVSVWNRLSIQPAPLRTVATVVIGAPEKMAADALAYSAFTHLKIKLSDDDPITRLEAIRNARPDANLIIDVNQGWTFEQLKTYLPAMERLKIAMIEQPLARGHDEMLDGFKSPVPLGADESCLDMSEYEVAAKRYDVINIKLDKCGGLTEAMEIALQAKRDGKSLMIGNMTGSSLAMAPLYVVGQLCDYIDIDGPLFLKEDIDHALVYGDGGIVSLPEPALWG